jgi:Carboxypeptidase regulatory-like domain
MAMKVLARIVFLGALCAMNASEAAAQAVYGSLVGNVSDSSGGAIPGATVTATQTETNLTREVVTNASGAYSIPNISLGTDEVVNVSNTPHFGNPNANISNVVFNTDGSIRSLNGVGSITTTDRAGWQYGEREWRLGARFGF